MRAISLTHVAENLAKALKKPLLFLAFPHEKLDDLPWTEIQKAAPYLRMDDNETSQALCDGYAFIVCDSDEERDRLFDLTVGDDGPTNANNYDGPARVYALTINDKGQSLNENT